MYFKMLKRVKKKILKAACIMKSDNLKKKNEIHLHVLTVIQYLNKNN